MMYKSLALSMATAAGAVKTDAKKNAKNLAKAGALGLATLASKANAFGDVGDLPDCQANGDWYDDYNYFGCQTAYEDGNCGAYGYDSDLNWLTGYEACGECGECYAPLPGCERNADNWAAEDPDTLTQLGGCDEAVDAGWCDDYGAAYDEASDSWNWHYGNDICEECGQCDGDNVALPTCQYAYSWRPWTEDQEATGYNCQEAADYNLCGNSGVIVTENYDDFVGYYDEYNYYSGYEACAECGECESDDRRRMLAPNKKLSAAEKKEILQRRLAAHPQKTNPHRQLTEEQKSSFQAKEAERRARKLRGNKKHHKKHRAKKH